MPLCGVREEGRPSTDRTRRPVVCQQALTQINPLVIQASVSAGPIRVLFDSDRPKGFVVGLRVVVGDVPLFGGERVRDPSEWLLTTAEGR